MGHSLGGYLATRYALKYPEHVQKLVLLSPMGLPVPPIAEQEGDENERRFNLDKLNISVTGLVLSPWLVRMWNNNITPQLLIRAAGPWGPRLVSKYVDARFPCLNEDELGDLRDYLYHISAGSGSGEYALAAMMAPGAWARDPLFPLMKHLEMPTTFIYGDADWMDPRQAEACLADMKVPAKVIRISNAGHQLFLDNPEEFNDVLCDIIIQNDSNQGTSGGI